MIGIIIQVIALIVAYLLGSIPTALLIGKKIKKIDIREHGSKNMGATNAFRVLGFKWGLTTFILDAIKGAFTVFFMKYIIVNFDFYKDTPFIMNTLVYGLAAFVGHLFPIFAKFKGGKGVSTGFGAIFAYAPIPSLVGLAIFFIVVGTKRIVSLASIVSFLMAPIIVFVYCLIDSLIVNDNLSEWYKYMDWVLFGTVTAISIIIIVKHIPNIRRIQTHDEQLVNFDAIEDETQPAFVDDERKNQDNKNENL